MNISGISNSKKPLWNLLSFVSIIVINECLKTVCGIVLVLLWSGNVGKTIKTLGFHDETVCSTCQVSMYHPETYSEPVKLLKCSVLRK